MRQAKESIMAVEMNRLAEKLERRRTVYVTRAATTVALKNRKLSVCTEKETETASLGEIRRVVLLGRAEVPSPVLYSLVKEGIPVDWLDRFGRPAGMLVPFGFDEGPLRLAQERFCLSSESLELAKDIVCAKLDNTASLLMRRSPLPNAWKSLRRTAQAAQSTSTLRGAEGMAAKLYFSYWASWTNGMPWSGRKPHPAPDPVNALLSLGYGLLHNRLASALRRFGLDPRRGILHAGRGTHCALASDLMEELRFAVDSTTLRLVRSGKLGQDDFAVKDGRCILNSGEAFQTVFEAFESMFSRKWACIDEENGGTRRISLNDRIDDSAEGFCLHIQGKKKYQAFRRTLWNAA